MNVAFVGAGAMATAMAGGLSKTTLFHSYLFVDINDEQLARVSRLLPTAITTKNLSSVGPCDVIVLSVKPQVAHMVCTQLRPFLRPQQLILSIMGGISLKSLAQWLNPTARIVRSMPNVALLVNQGTTAYSGNYVATTEDLALVNQIFAALGSCTEVEETQLDAVTGVSGSSPAFTAIFIEALADGGVMSGLPRELALHLAANAVFGASKMIALGSVSNPASLKDMVCSPAGTSIAGVSVLEGRAFRSSVIEAVVAAKKRSSELSNL